MRPEEPQDSHPRRISERQGEFYRLFFDRSPEGWWVAEFDKPLPIHMPIPRQAEHLIKYAYLADCNRAFLLMYGYRRKEDFLGARFPQLFVRSDERNIANLLSFLGNRYRMDQAETHELDRDGHSRFFLNSVTGVVSSGFLVRVWGRQVDITATKTADLALRETVLQLTQMQKDILRHSMDGLGLKEIADRLHTHPKAVATVRSRIMKRFHVRSLAELVRVVIEKRLV